MNKICIENKSSENFDCTVEKLTEIIVQGGWKVISTHDLQETMKKNSYEVMPVKVLEICKPAYASRLLSQNHERMYATFMPCRIAIYEKKDGLTYISRLNSGMVASQIGVEILENVMTSSFNEVEIFINKITAKE